MRCLSLTVLPLCGIISCTSSTGKDSGGPFTPPRISEDSAATYVTCEADNTFVVHAHVDDDDGPEAVQSVAVTIAPLPQESPGADSACGSDHCDLESPLLIEDEIWGMRVSNDNSRYDIGGIGTAAAELSYDGDGNWSGAVSLPFETDDREEVRSCGLGTYLVSILAENDRVDPGVETEDDQFKRDFWYFEFGGGDSAPRILQATASCGLDEYDREALFVTVAGADAFDEDPQDGIWQVWAEVYNGECVNLTDPWVDDRMSLPWYEEEGHWQNSYQDGSAWTFGFACPLSGKEVHVWVDDYASNRTELILNY